MIQKKRRRLPDGISSFEMIIRGGYVYVDKTDLVWQIANGSMFNYLCRPRRFGKSILLDTLACYFEGRKELFEGLKIMDMEEEWTAHPVVRLDLSNGGATASELTSYLDNTFYNYEEEYEINVRPGTSLANRFANIITRAHKKVGQPVAVLIDEYDSPLQHSWNTPEHDACREIYRSVFAVLKSCSVHEQFVFITGITKFTQVSLFSVLNNLSNITFYPEYAAVCGITKQELEDNFMPEIERMGEKNGWTAEQTLEELRANYDGYHFSGENMVDVYNPYSLICALSRGSISNYWASSGSTSMLPKFVSDMELRIKDFEKSYIDRVTMETSDVGNGGAEQFLYQSGYLTIKDSDAGGYVLGIPNYEVRTALYRVVIPALKLTKNGGLAAAEQQIRDNLYAEPFKGDEREVVSLAIELDDEGKGLLDWKRVE